MCNRASSTNNLDFVSLEREADKYGHRDYEDYYGEETENIPYVGDEYDYYGSDEGDAPASLLLDQADGMVMMHGQMSRTVVAPLKRSISHSNSILRWKQISGHIKRLAWGARLVETPILALFLLAMIVARGVINLRTIQTNAEEGLIAGSVVMLELERNAGVSVCR